jgi:hypothetical protein
MCPQICIEVVYEFRQFMRHFCSHCYDRWKKNQWTTFVTYRNSEQQYTHTGFADNVQKTVRVFNLVGVAWDDTVHCENSLDPSLYKNRRGELRLRMNTVPILHSVSAFKVSDTYEKANREI